MKLDSLHITGNGPGAAVVTVKDQLTITFNPSIECRPIRGEIQISNCKHAKLQTDCRPFIVAAPSLGAAWCHEFEEVLRKSAMTLEPQLGCLPSSGLTAIHSALQLAKRVYVSRTPLKPNLVRAADMSQRKPLPCAFHNWLGERRIGLSLLRKHGPERLRWNSFYLDPAVNRGKPNESNPLTLLTDLFSQARPFQEREFAGRLEQLTNIDQREWVRNADEKYLRALERYFFLCRHSSDTPINPAIKQILI